MNRFFPTNTLILIVFQLFVVLYAISYLIFRKRVSDSFSQQIKNSSKSFIYNMKTNGLKNPIGYDFGIPSLSWIVNTSLSSVLISSKVEISNDSNFKMLLHESPASSTISSIDYRVTIPLTPRTRYYWRVTVETTSEKIISPISFFETSKMTEKWKANWITPQITSTFRKVDLPLVRKKFSIKETPKKARIYITGLGLYELYVNGRKADDELFTPFYNGYDNWLQYQTYDITSLLTKGENVVGAMLGDGWAKGRWGIHGRAADMLHENDDRGWPTDLYIDKYVLFAEIRIECESGETVIVTDESWKFSKSEIILTNIYDGEVIDGKIELKKKGWSNINYDDENWLNMKIIKKPKKLGNLTARYSPPVIVKHRIKPKKIFTDKNDDVIIDMGQNMVGWIQFSTDEILPKNFEIVLEFGEVLKDGNFFRGNLRTAQQQFRYISNGKEKILNAHPHFTFYGFQYIRLIKWYGKANLSNFVGLSIYSDLTQTGFLKTSNSDVNKLIQNVLWSQRDNFLDVPTDCPQRDERMGWTGDAQSFSGTALFNMDCYPFYRKFVHDIHQFQKNSDEPFVPVVVPFLKGLFNYTLTGRCGWSDSGCIIPWRTYVFSGKKQILEEQIDSMKMWVDWITANSALSPQKISKLITTAQTVKSTNNHQRAEYISKSDIDEFNYLWLGTKFNYGDWLALDGPTDPKINRGGHRGGTEISFLCSSFYYYSTTLLAKAAKVLEMEETEAHYSKLAKNILKSIRHEFFTKNGRCAVQTQTAQVISLCFGIAPEEARETVISTLYKLLTEDAEQTNPLNFDGDDDSSLFSMKMKTGMLGTPHLCEVLSNFGYPQFSYNIFMNPNSPGWLYMVRRGATTTWERWDSILSNGQLNDKSEMNSFNHYWVGSILEWLYSNVCGIAPSEKVPGFKEFVLQPQPSLNEKYLTFAEAVFESPMGTIKSAWKIVESNNVQFNFTVPFNTVAHLRIRNAHFSSLKMVVGKANLSQKENDIVGDLKSGQYSMIVSVFENEFKLETKFN